MNQKDGEGGRYGHFYDNKRHAQLKRTSASSQVKVLQQLGKKSQYKSLRHTNQCILSTKNASGFHLNHSLLHFTVQH